MDVIPFVRFVGAIICFGLAFYFMALTVSTFVDLLGNFDGIYASILLRLWSALPAFILFFAGIRLVMVQQKRGG